MVLFSLPSGRFPPSPAPAPAGTRTLWGGRRQLSLCPGRGHQPGRRPPSWTPSATRPGWSGRPPGGWTAICRRRPAPWRTSLPRDGPAAGPVERSPGRPPLGGGGDFPPAGRRGGVLWPGDCAASLQLTDGTFRTWEETALSALDGQALEEACALAQAGGAPSGRACRGSRPPSAATGPCGTPRGLLDPGPHRGGDPPRPPGDGPP